jgi:hypothetical protein
MLYAGRGRRFPGGQGNVHTVRGSHCLLRSVPRCVAGMVHAIPNGHMMPGHPGAGMPPQMMAAQMAAPHMLPAAPIGHTGAQRTHVQGQPWSGGAQPAASNSQSSARLGTENRGPPPARSPSGWTPIGAKRLPRSCFSRRNTLRRCAATLSPLRRSTRMLCMHGS